MSNSGVPIVKDIARAGGQAIEGTLNVVNGIIKNPLPVVTMVAATWALGPAGLAVTSSTATAAALASGAIAASQGKNIGQIAQSALLAYGGGKFAEFTGAGDFTSQIGNNIGGTTGSAVASGLNNAFFNSSVAALGGKNVGEAFGAGFLGGAAGSLAGSAMSTEMGQSFFGSVKDSFGLDDSQMKYIQGAAKTMGTAAISGQDPQVALTNYVAQNIANVGKTEVGKQFTSAKNYFVNSYDAWEASKADQQSIIDRRNALYEEAKPVADQYTALRTQYDDVVSKLKADNDYIQENRGGYDAAMAAYESDKSNENVDRVNAEIEKLKPYTDSFDRNKAAYEQLDVQIRDLNTRLTDYSLRLNGFDSDIQASNDKITQLSDTFADAAAKYEGASKQVGQSLVDMAESDIKTAEDAEIEAARREAARQEEERQNTLRIEEERKAEEARAAAQAEAEEPPPEEPKTEPVTIPGDDGGTATVDPKTGEVTFQDPTEEPWTPPTDLPPANTPTGLDNEGGVNESGVIMPDGTFKTWRELDELAGVPPGTIYTDGGTTITEQELLDIINRTYTPRGTTTTTAPAPTTPAPNTPAPTTPTNQPTTQPTQQNNPLGMLALLDILGQPQQQQQTQQPVEGAKIELMDDIFGTNFFTPRPEPIKKYSSGGEIEALLHLLRS